MISRIQYAAFAALLFVATAPGLVQEARAQQTSDSVSLELNKLEDKEKGCTASFVIQNSLPEKFESLRVSMYMFRIDGIIDRSWNLELGPLLANKLQIKEFVMKDTRCDDVGSFLINTINECRTDAGPVEDCLARLKVSSRSTVEIRK